MKLRRSRDQKNSCDVRILVTPAKAGVQKAWTPLDSPSAMLKVVSSSNHGFRRNDKKGKSQIPEWNIWFHIRSNGSLPQQAAALASDSYELSVFAQLRYYFFFIWS
jgi:hypothetical protein